MSIVCTKKEETVNRIPPLLIRKTALSCPFLVVIRNHPRIIPAYSSSESSASSAASASSSAVSSAVVSAASVSAVVMSASSSES